MASKKKKEALAVLDEANKEYKQVCSDLKKMYKELDKMSDSAISLVSDVEVLIESIRHRPWSFKTIKHKISVVKKKFVSSIELKRKERNKNIAAGVVAGVATGGLTLLVFMKEFCGKNLVKWIICIALFVFVLAGFLVYKLFNSVKTAKKAYEQSILIKEETNKNKSLLAKTEAHIKSISTTIDLTKKSYNELKDCANCNYKELPTESQTGLRLLYNSALTLAELVSTQLG